MLEVHRGSWFIGLLACWRKKTQLTSSFLSATPGSQMSDLFHLELQREQTNSVWMGVYLRERERDLDELGIMFLIWKLNVCSVFVNAENHLWVNFTLKVTLSIVARGDNCSLYKKVLCPCWSYLMEMPHFSSTCAASTVKPTKKQSWHELMWVLLLIKLSKVLIGTGPNISISPCF